MSLGLPVYNGARYVGEAIESVLGQDFGDFELIVSDNGSTDGTQAVCEGYARSDPRIRYLRSDENRGAAWNFNRVFHEARAPYFKWCAHDDVLARDYLSECITRLENDPSVVLSHCVTADIDETGAVRHGYPPDPLADASDPLERWADVLANYAKCFDVFGIIRTDVLRETGLVGPYSGSDVVLLAELALLGRYARVPRTLFYRREHDQRSMRAFPIARDRAAWFDPAMENVVTLPNWRLAWEFGKVVHDRLPRSHRSRAYREVARWASKRRRLMVREVGFKVAVGPWRSVTAWARRLRGRRPSSRPHDM